MSEELDVSLSDEEEEEEEIDYLTPEVVRINSKLDELFEAGQVPDADQVEVGQMLFVCDATEEQWRQYVECEEQTLRSRYLYWDETRDQIFIVEFPGWAHDSFVAGLTCSFYYVFETLIGTGASYDSTGSRDEPDLSFIPFRPTVEPLGVKPPVDRWGDFKTIRIEVGVTQSWGYDRGQLDGKALRIWGTRPGIAYVLCVSVAADLSGGGYKLYDFTAGGDPPPFQIHPTPIEAPATFVRMNSRSVLGLPDGASLPRGFPDPELVIDLFDVLVHARR